MELVHATDIIFRFDGQVENLLEKVSFSIDESSRIGLVGDNGAGKTTLLDIIRGHLAISGGNLNISQGTAIGYLPQEVRLEVDITLRDYLWQADNKLFDLRRRLADSEKASPQYAEAVARFYDAGGGELDASIKKILAGFNISEDKLDITLTKLSGGEKTKVAMARILLQKPGLMLLDEPTNHLEIASLEWLDQYLPASSLPYIVVSHDRRFLDKCVLKIWELGNKNLTIYSGNYSFYKNRKETEIRRQIQRYENQQKKIKKLKEAAQQRRQQAARMEKFKLSRSVTKRGGIRKRDDGSGRSGVSSADKMRSARAVEKRIQQILEKDKVENPHLDRERKITFTSVPLKTPVVLKIESLKKSFGRHTVIKNLHMVVNNRARLGIIGCNGSGKTTLLRIITGYLKPTSGSFVWAPRAKVGYFSQEHETLDHTRSIIEEVLQGRQQGQSRARTILGRLNLRGDKVHQAIGTLSLGERSKVALAKILFSDANVLVLDEPTNHIEISAREAFEEALEDFTGTVIIASHDRYLLDRIALQVFDIENTRLL